MYQYLGQAHVNDLFEQMDLGDAVYNGDSEVETGLAAATVNCGSETGCRCVSLDSQTSQWCDMWQMLQSSEKGCCYASLLPEYDDDIEMPSLVDDDTDTDDDYLICQHGSEDQL